jgi:hypothetical protein
VRVFEVIATLTKGNSIGYIDSADFIGTVCTAND